MFEGTDRFEVRGQLGKGGMGVVYRVWDREQQTEAALKRAAHPGQDGLYRLKREFRARAGLAHPNLIQLYELVAEGDSCFFTMELVEGLTFLNWIRAGRDDDQPSPQLDGATVALAATATEAVDNGAVPGFEPRPDSAASSHDLPTVRHGDDRHATKRLRPWRRRPLARRPGVQHGTRGFVARWWALLRGLAALHETGQMHRDIKSSNVLIEPSGRGRHPRLRLDELLGSLRRSIGQHGDRGHADLYGAGAPPGRGDASF